MSTLEQNMRIVNALTTATALLRAGGGNPNHDPATGQFSSGGGGGRHERRRKRKKRRLRELRVETHETIKDLRESHRAERKDLNKLNRQGWRQLKREQLKDRKQFMRDEKKDWRDFKKDKPDREARNDWRAQHRESKENLREQHRDERKDYKESSHQDHVSLSEDHKANFARVREDFREELATIGKRKGGQAKRSMEDLGRRTVSIAVPRMGHGKLAKASSAESILRHCLRRLGFTAAYKRGELTGAQHLELLEAVRLYGRAWLRHEAESFARHYLLSDGDSRRLGFQSGVLRAQWIQGPDGFLILQDRPGLASHFRRFFGRAKQFVRETIVAGVMSLLGPAPLTGEELDAAERAAQVQDQFFDRFHDEVKLHPPLPRVDTQVIIVQPPAMTPGQFIARAEKYADSAWQTAQRVNRQAAAQNPALKYERNIMGDARHCGQCLGVTSMRWQPIGTLPEIGERECGPYCHCHFVYSDEPGGAEYIQGTKGLVPAPRPAIELFPDDDEAHMIAEPPGGVRVPIAGPLQ